MSQLCDDFDNFELNKRLKLLRGDDVSICIFYITHFDDYAVNPIDEAGEKVRHRAKARVKVLKSAGGQTTSSHG